MLFCEQIADKVVVCLKLNIMRKIILLGYAFLAVMVSACSNLKELSNGSKVNPKLSGEWELFYITGPRIAFDGLYPRRKPMLRFDLEKARVSGNTSCNSLSGELKAEAENKISFKKGFATTKMFCEGTGEHTFLKALEQVETYAIKDSTLSLSSNLGVIMRFKKK